MLARACTTSDPFNAIAEPRRRHILEFLAAEERSVGDIADALELNQPLVSKHLHVLLDVGLVGARRDGRRTMYRTNADTLRTVHDWSGMFAHITGAASCAASRHTRRPGNDDHVSGRRPAGADSHHRRRHSRQGITGGDLRLPDYATRAPERNARRQATADDPRTQAGWAVVSRSGLATTVTSGDLFKASSGRCCSKSGDHCSCRAAPRRTSFTASRQ